MNEIEKTKIDIEEWKKIIEEYNPPIDKSHLVQQYLYLVQQYYKAKKIIDQYQEDNTCLQNTINDLLQNLERKKMHISPTNKIRSCYENQPIKLLDGKVGMVIRLYWQENSLGAQVPGENHIRTIKHFHLYGGVLYELPPSE